MLNELRTTIQLTTQPATDNSIYFFCSHKELMNFAFCFSNKQYRITEMKERDNNVYEVTFSPKTNTLTQVYIGNKRVA